ncbi:unnamed protein product [Fraxinus pennsylvanica]|uniref:Uncharacterized protein n=1 Tax=Fraxinus pennsylvanica TaxID=56036 RepID=A0AAD2E8I4_9LAMI|nr:unnamed protein product [Fraxinus pennsylvanica]
MIFQPAIEFKAQTVRLERQYRNIYLYSKGEQVTTTDTSVPGKEFHFTNETLVGTQKNKEISQKDPIILFSEDKELTTKEDDKDEVNADRMLRKAGLLNSGSTARIVPSSPPCSTYLASSPPPPPPPPIYAPLPNPWGKHECVLLQLQLLGCLAGVEMVLKDVGYPVKLGSGVAAASAYFSNATPLIPSRV